MARGNAMDERNEHVGDLGARAARPAVAVVVIAEQVLHRLVALGRSGGGGRRGHQRCYTNREMIRLFKVGGALDSREEWQER